MTFTFIDFVFTEKKDGHVMCPVAGQMMGLAWKWGVKYSEPPRYCDLPTWPERPKTYQNLKVRAVLVTAPSGLCVDQLTTDLQQKSSPSLDTPSQTEGCSSCISGHSKDKID